MPTIGRDVPPASGRTPAEITERPSATTRDGRVVHEGDPTPYKILGLQPRYHLDEGVLTIDNLAGIAAMRSLVPGAIAGAIAGSFVAPGVGTVVGAVLGFFGSPLGVAAGAERVFGSPWTHEDQYIESQRTARTSER